ncbi:MAG: NAD(P)-binding domain-containing protein [Emergencia sp.]
MKRLAVVGCGVMGSSIINALMNNGFDVTIVDLNRTSAERFIERGACYSETIDGIDPDINCIVLNLPNHKIASTVITNAIASKLKGKMLINTTTSTPDEVKEMDIIASRLGMKHLDAKIENYPGDIGTQNAYLIYSGSEEVFNEYKDALKALGKAVYLGKDVIGASVTDIAVLEVHFGAIAALGEACAYCIKNNYPVEKFIEQTRIILPIMLEGNLRAFSDELKEYTGEFADATECTLNIETTAMDTILRAMNSTGVKTPCGDSVIKLFKDAIDSGNSKKNVVAIVNELV